MKLMECFPEHYERHLAQIIAKIIEICLLRKLSIGLTLVNHNWKGRFTGSILEPKEN